MLAKYFCSLTRNRMELMKLAPACMAAALTPSSRSTFSLSGTSKALRSIGVRQRDLAHDPCCGASCTGVSWSLTAALALAMATAASAVRDAGFWRESIGRGKAPTAVGDHANARAVALGVDDVLDLVLARDDELVEIAADAHVGIGRAFFGGGIERGVGEFLFVRRRDGRDFAEGGDGSAPDGDEE